MKIPENSLQRNMFELWVLWLDVSKGIGEQKVHIATDVNEPLEHKQK